LTIELVVGLGNPGAEYEATRHNVGFWFVDEVARIKGCHFTPERKFNGQVCKVPLSARNIYLIKPSTYMNRSGAAVAAIASYYKIDAESMLVVHDELDLPVGKARLKKGGGHGGHNGLRDIVSALGTKDFLRLRLGIDHPGVGRDVSNYVLGRPSLVDREQIESAMDAALQILPDLLDGNTQKAMNQLHRG